ncbi:MAG: SAP domain-containing protein, partial [Candidatus Binatia bacterium]
SAHALAKRLIATEWARALGRLRPRPLLEEDKIRQWAEKYRENKRKVEDTEEFLAQCRAAAVHKISQASIPELRTLLKRRGLKVQGTKKDLMATLLVEVPSPQLLADLGEVRKLAEIRRKMIEEVIEERRRNGRWGSAPKGDWARRGSFAEAPSPDGWLNGKK